MLSPESLEDWSSDPVEESDPSDPSDPCEPLDPLPQAAPHIIKTAAASAAMTVRRITAPPHRSPVHREPSDTDPSSPPRTLPRCAPASQDGLTMRSRGPYR